MILPSPSKGFAFITVVFMILASGVAFVTVTVSLAPVAEERQTDETFKKLKALESAIVTYRAQHGTTSPDILDDLVTKDGDESDCDADNDTMSSTYLTIQGWCGPYIDNKVNQDTNDYKTDGWGTEINWNDGTGTLTSYGPDRASGGGDDIAITF